mmetsp:Transcript_3864/g.5760  ORF Transcript_3864/g.5760 Transcript_3864/m.5760 type:complete len:85 (+) Transcript_3864:173-427(+)
MLVASSFTEKEVDSFSTEETSLLHGSEQNDDDDDCTQSTPPLSSYVHTLNTKSGFRRKLNAIGIGVSDSDFVVVPKGDAKGHHV